MLSAQRALRMANMCSALPQRRCFPCAPALALCARRTHARQRTLAISANAAQAASRQFTLEVPRYEPPPEQPRLDAYVSGQLTFTSRAKVAAAIKEGLVKVNGKLVTKSSYAVRPGDLVDLVLPEPAPMEAAPEDIPIEVVFEDAHLLVVNKPAGLVVHPSAGHASGTLVNAVLHHCALPAMRVDTGSTPPSALLGADASAAAAGGEEDTEGDDEDEESSGFHLVPEEPAGQRAGPAPVLRPGIVHRIDKGTSGLLVIAKDEQAHAGLCKQFAARSVDRTYIAILLGVPNPTKGRIEAPIGRDPRERKRMAVVWAPGAGAKPAASRYRVLEILANGGASVVQWNLESGRTHQIRVHAKHLGYSMLNDVEYGGGGGGAAAVLSQGGRAMERTAADVIVDALPESRPMLHARSLGFLHPITGEQMKFEVPPPADFARVLELLRAVPQKQPF